LHHAAGYVRPAYTRDTAGTDVLDDAKVYQNTGNGFAEVHTGSLRGVYLS
jgi:hypothetical protein